jgi:predicted Zn-dependent protease
MNASIAAGRSGGAGAREQEIQMLKQAARTDPHQPMTYFNLAQAYHERGSKHEANAVI